MWLLSNEAMNKLLDGDYTSVILSKKKWKDLSIRELFCVQIYYDSYDGFRKFYNKKIKPIIDGIKFVDETSLLGKFIKLLRK